MAELQLKHGDIPLWLMHYLQWRTLDGVGSKHVESLLTVVTPSILDDRLTPGQRIDLENLVFQINEDRAAGATAGDRLEHYQ
jgi:hypothetical protein